MFGIATAQAQDLGPPPLPSLWQVFLADPSFLITNLIVFGVLVTVALLVRNRYARFFRLQREALEHRKTADAQALARGESTEQMIARQYEAVNAFNQQIVTRAEDALRISTETLAQINTMNQSLVRIADRLERLAGPTA